MSFIKKTWLARIGVGLNRFRMNNSTDVVLESNPVSVTQQGDQLSADNMNNLETRIGNAFDEMAGNLAPIEVSPATTNHAVGTQLVYNGILYKVSSAISTDDNLVVGTNIEPYPVSSALSDISVYGSNSNGNYMKFSNGVMVCWGETTIDVNQTSSSGVFPYFGSKTITFPVEFNSSPIGFCNIFEYASYHNSLVSSASKTGMTLQHSANVNYTTNYIGWIAIGLWK